MNFETFRGLHCRSVEMDVTFVVVQKNPKLWSREITGHDFLVEFGPSLSVDVEHEVVPYLRQVVEIFVGVGVDLTKTIPHVFGHLHIFHR